MFLHEEAPLFTKKEGEIYDSIEYKFGDILLQSLQATRHALLSEVETLNDTDVNIRPRRDKWSIIQIMHHLHLVEQSITSALVYALQKREGKFVPFKDLQLTLDRTYKREAPQQMQPTETLMKKQHGIQLLEHSRQELLHTLHSIIDEKRTMPKFIKTLDFSRT